jgi:CheY-like chemotaxis protein
VTGRIAVIDDEAPNRAYLQTLLGTAGFEVRAAAGGNEGVALVEKERPDLVLVDLMMPEVDGFMVCERIPIVLHHAQGQATAQFNELMQALAAV